MNCGWCGHRTIRFNKGDIEYCKRCLDECLENDYVPVCNSCKNRNNVVINDRTHNRISFACIGCQDITSSKLKIMHVYYVY